MAAPNLSADTEITKIRAMTAQRENNVNGRFQGKRALVAGGSSGIGRAIAAALAAEGAQVAIAARTPASLADTAADIGAVSVVADLSTGENSAQAAAKVLRQFGGLDILVLSSGHYLHGRIADIEDGAFEHLMAANLFGPAALVRSLIPALTAARGDVLFVNSTVTRAANLAERSYYAAGFQALKAFADGLRDEVNDQGVRVTSLYPGSTATPRQEQLHRLKDKPYRPERLLQAEDVASIALSALALPATAETTDIYLRPRFKS